MSPEHLFISYAYEDEDLAKWLALRLAKDGYLVWFDQYKLLGGESYPKDIEDAIKNKTFRMLHLVSRNSKDKANPSKERTAGLNVSRAKGIDFLIPINVDGMKPDELHWMTSDITFIPFYKNWADGYRKLLKKLEQIQTPKPLLEKGPSIVADLMNSRRKIQKKEENIFSNKLAFTQIPNIIKWTVFNRELRSNEIGKLCKVWPFYKIDGRNFLSFESPPIDLNADILQAREIKYTTQKTIHEIQTDNVVKYLLESSIQVKFIELGMRTTKIGNYYKLYFPVSLLPKDKISFIGYNGHKTYVQVFGTRIRPGIGPNRKYNYYVSPRFKVKKDGAGDYFLFINTQLILTDLNNEVLEPRTALSSRKNICGGWWNDHWLQRNLAFASFLSGGKSEIVIGYSEFELVKLNSSFVKYISPLAIVENDDVNQSEEEIRKELLIHNNEEMGVE